MEPKNHEINDEEFEQINKLYDECIIYLKDNIEGLKDPDYETITEEFVAEAVNEKAAQNIIAENTIFKLENENLDKAPKNQTPFKEIVTQSTKAGDTISKNENEKSIDSLDSVLSEPRSERLRKLSQQLPKIIITQSNTSLDARKVTLGGHSDVRKDRSEKTQSSPSLNSRKEIKSISMPKNEVAKVRKDPFNHVPLKNKKRNIGMNNTIKHRPLQRSRSGYGNFPKRLVSKNGFENIALISNVPFEKIRLLNDTFHTLINLRWRWIVIGTIVVHFAIWLVFAIFWYITALAHYDFEPDPPKRTCVTGGKDFVTIFLASVEAQTTIGFGDRAIDEECPESIFLFIMQLILGTGLSGVLTCVVYAKLTRPEKLSKDGVGFSKKAVISMRDGKLCLMIRAWDLNYDHIISSEFTANFVNTYRTKEGEMIRYYARSLSLQQRQFLLWPVTLVHVIDATSPLYAYAPDHIANNSYEITVSLKGASASMGTFTQSQTSYLPKEIAWGYRFPPVVKYNSHKQKYVIDHKKLDIIEAVDTPYCCAKEIYHCPTPDKLEPPSYASTPNNFSDKVAGFRLERSSSFRKKNKA